MTLQARVTALAQAVGGDVKGLSLGLGPPAAVQALLSGGAALNTWLATPANLTAFQALLNSLLGPAALASNTAAMQAVAASSRAMNAVIGNQTVLNALTTGPCREIFRSSTALTAETRYGTNDGTPIDFGVPVHVHSAWLAAEGPITWQLGWSDDNVNWSELEGDLDPYVAGISPKLPVIPYVAIAGRHRFWRMTYTPVMTTGSVELRGWR